MAKNHVIVIEINNKYNDYAKCMKLIESLCSDKSYYEDLTEYKIMKYKETTINANKLEEPIDGKNINSSIVPVNEQRYNLSHYLENAHFHIRIYPNNNDINEYLANLHYLLLLISKFDSLAVQKRISVFLIPRTGDKFPFGSEGNTDTELYKLASERLRAFIDEGKHGIIYGVANAFTQEDTTIVKALDSGVHLKISDCFPVIVFKNCRNESDELDKKYFAVSKVRNKEIADNTFSDEEILNLNHFSMLFYDGIVKKYLEEAQSLHANNRFGFANHGKARLALADYVFECSYWCLKNKMDNSYINFKKIYSEEVLAETKKRIDSMNIFTFSIFAFIVKFSENTNYSNYEIREILEIYIDQSIEISDALNQLIQNSILHSQQHMCVLSFFKGNDKESNAENLKILISDLSDKTILETFHSELNRENNVISKVSEKIQLNLDNVKAANSQLSDTHCDIDLKNLFNDFKSCNDEVLNLWEAFRQCDSSAHIGLALFSHIMEKCEAEYWVKSSNDYDCLNSNIYIKTQEEGVDESISIPGTEYNISIPIRESKLKSFFSFSQINYENYYEDYKCYANFIDREIYKINISSVLLSAVNEYIKAARSALTDGATGKLTVSFSRKFLLQLAFTKYWLQIFETVPMGEMNKRIFYLDFRDIEFKDGYLEQSGLHREVVIKGFINALGIFIDNFKENFYFALINLDDMMMKTFKDVAVSLAIKNFPKNFQLFVSGIHSKDRQDTQLHMVGTTYGEAVQNAFVFSIETGVKSFESKSFYLAANLCKPFSTSNKNAAKVNIFPFTMFLKNDSENNNMFFDIVNATIEKELIDGKGYKISNTHTRLGSKVHIDTFYEMSFLFYRTIMANRVAFEIIRDIKNNHKEINIKNDNIVFYGYASYSQAILTSLTNIVREYRKNKGSAAKVTYAVYQYNLQSEAAASDIQVYLNENEVGDGIAKVIQIVPISSTLTTFEKMWLKFADKYNNNQNKVKYVLSHNHTVVWVRDNIKKKITMVENRIIDKSCIDLDIENDYFSTNNIKNKTITTKFKNLVDCQTVKYIITLYSIWQRPEKCLHCFPKNVLDELPLVSTDPTSTVPSQQIYLNSETNGKCCVDIDVDIENLKRIQALKDSICYGHYKRGKNHYQFFIDTNDYFARVENSVKIWLETKSEEYREEMESINIPYQNVIFSPEHNTNVGFSQYVNVHYFRGTAEIISINEDKEFRSNFVCEHSALKNTIEHLFAEFMDKHTGSKPVKFYFADDNIITGATFHKASNLIQSLIPKEFLNFYGTNVFEKCFFLIDRLSDRSKMSYTIEPKNFLSFCHIDISNTRKHGDSCVSCKLLTSAERFMRRSTTVFSSDYWSDKVKDYGPVPFENISDEKKNDPYIMLALSHILKNLFSFKQGVENEYFNMISDLFAFCLMTKKNKNRLNYLNILDKYSILLENERKTPVHCVKLTECLIKIISRPFFTFNQEVKTQAMHFIITISERILHNSENNDITNVVDKIVSMYGDSKENLLKYLQNHIFNALSNLKSTYLIRKETMRAVLKFTDEYVVQNPNLEEISDILENFWLHYSVYVQKVIDGYDDETRSLWLEHLIITGKENFVKDEINENEHSEPLDLMILKLTSGLSEISKKYFNVFIREIFLANARIVYDSADSFCKCNDNINTNSYLFDMWNKFMKIDLGYIEKTPDYLEKQLQLECELFDFLNKNNGSSEEEAVRGGIIKNRYDQLLKSIKDLVTQKYNLKYDDIHIAILTVGNGNKHNLRLHDFEMISETLGLDYNNDYANYKYTIKQRVSKALSESDSKEELERYGYFLIKELETSEKNTDNYRVPYFILSFCISDKMLRADIELKPIVPVYMYVSIMADSHPQKNILPWFIMRDILTHRNLLNKYFVADFTSDVLQRYAHSVGTEAVLKTEKEISHSPLKNDFIHLEQIWGMKKDFEQDVGKMHDATAQLSREKMLMWFAARNFCNTMTARLHNRVLRNINKDFGEIIDESSKQNDKKEGVKLYVDYNSNDGFSTPMQTVGDVIPSSDDIIFNLLDEIISFKGLDEIDRNRKAATRDYSNKFYTYNLDYVKNIIYRICFDAIRFSRGSGAECEDFIARIKNHYAFLRVKNAQNRGNRFNKIVSTYKTESACEMYFSMETSESECFDWLVIKNKLFKKEDGYAVTASITKKLEDPLDFSDGHMSLIAQKEFLVQLYGRDEEKYINRTMYDYDDNNEYFVTRLPIISKQKGEC